MEHKLQTNEGFILTRDNKSFDLMNQPILDWTELPWWLETDSTNEKFDYFFEALYPDLTTSGSRFYSIYGIYTTNIYSTSTTDSLSSPTTDLGKLYNSYITGRSLTLQSIYQNFPKVLVWDINNGMVYRIYTSNSTLQVLLAEKLEYDSNKVYSFPAEFGTKIYFKFRCIAEETMRYLQNPDEHELSSWTYRINMIPVYHDIITYNPAFTREPYISDSEITGGTSLESRTAWKYRPDINGWTAGVTQVVVSPCLYHDLGEVSSLRFCGSVYLNSASIDIVNNLPITGRFIAGIDNVSMTFTDSSGVFSISDSNPTIIEGHTYEYNIYNHVFNLIDITGTI